MKKELERKERKTQREKDTHTHRDKYCANIESDTVAQNRRQSAKKEMIEAARLKVNERS